MWDALHEYAKNYDHEAADKRIAELKATFDRREAREKRRIEEMEQRRRTEEGPKREQRGRSEHLEGRSTREEQTTQHGMADRRGPSQKQVHWDLGGQREGRGGVMRGQDGGRRQQEDGVSRRNWAEGRGEGDGRDSAGRRGGSASYASDSSSSSCSSSEKPRKR